jgi:hypothetical protein
MAFRLPRLQDIKLSGLPSLEDIGSFFRKKKEEREEYRRRFKENISVEKTLKPLAKEVKDTFRPKTGRFPTLVRQKTEAIARTPLTPKEQKVARKAFIVTSSVARGAAGYTGADEWLAKKARLPLIKPEPQGTDEEMLKIAGEIAGFMMGPGKAVSLVEGYAAPVLERIGIRALPTLKGAIPTAKGLVPLLTKPKIPIRLGTALLAETMSGIPLAIAETKIKDRPIE